jgi:hypothetical protein
LLAGFLLLLLLLGGRSGEMEGSVVVLKDGELSLSLLSLSFLTSRATSVCDIS